MQFYNLFSPRTKSLGAYSLYLSLKILVYLQIFNSFEGKHQILVSVVPKTYKVELHFQMFLFTYVDIARSSSSVSISSKVPENNLLQTSTIV